MSPRIGPQFRVVNLPAICEDQDHLPVEQSIGRKNGEALWPAQFSLEELAVRRQLMGSRSFAAQFLGNPLPNGGDLIKAEWLDYRYERIPDDLKATYLAEMIRRKVTYPNLKRMLIEAADTHNPSALYTEDTSNATALIQELKTRDTVADRAASG